MSVYDKSRSTGTAATRSGSDYNNRLDYEGIIEARYDSLVDAIMGSVEAEALKHLFADGTMDQLHYRQQTQVPNGDVVPMRADSEDLTFMTNREGGVYDWKAFIYRLATKHTATFEKIDSFGLVKQSIDNLEKAAKRTLLFMYADVLNRGIYDGTGGSFTTPVVCRDGGALCDSDRVSQDPNAPTWSNLETNGATLSEDYLEQVMINARNQTDDAGDQMFQEVSHVYVPTAKQAEMWRLMETPQELGGGNNDLNFATKLAWTWSVIPQLDSDKIYFRVGPNDPINGLTVRWFERPGLKDMNFEDPDRMGKRIKFGFALGAVDTRETLRGGIIA